MPARAADGSQRGARDRQHHGLSTLKRAVTLLGSRAIDARTTVGRALGAWRRDLIDDLGGREAISTQQAPLIEIAVRSKLMLDSVDAWLLGRPLINQRRRVLFPIVLQRQTLARELTHTLSLLGLERRPRKPLDFGTYLAERYPAEGGVGGGAGPSEGGTCAHAASDPAGSPEEVPR